jgi:hypothetical protein
MMAAPLNPGLFVQISEGIQRREATTKAMKRNSAEQSPPNH